MVQVHPGESSSQRRHRANVGNSSHLHTKMTIKRETKKHMRAYISSNTTTMQINGDSQSYQKNRGCTKHADTQTADARKEPQIIQCIPKHPYVGIGVNSIGNVVARHRTRF